MSETRIIVQVHALQPGWIELQKSKYRIYVDDDLMTERTWIWDLQTYIEETLWAELAGGISHTVRLETIMDEDVDSTRFGLQNLTVNGWPSPDHGGHRSELSFMLA
jgi:hypothetical protein